MELRMKIELMKAIKKAKAVSAPIATEAGHPIKIDIPGFVEKKLHLLKGDIADTDILNQVGAAVNAANPVMYHGGGGTNWAFSTVIDKQDWDKQVDAWKKRTNKSELSVSEVCVFDTPDAQERKIIVFKKIPRAPLLMQVLGPDLSDEKERSTKLIIASKGAIRQAYINIFNACRERKITSVLLPLLSAGIFAGPYFGKSEWSEAISEALCEAIAGELGNSESSITDFKVIDYSQYPLI